ncbi:4-hydroxy-tetrahydrodipicolinate reductase [Halalkalicoccus subterraneus]|uniref:4-hydroxy-tetrahydrodipicolinate reductase n=1 Tax=Halalkalicoccus subterraneus TaxID=2675002 RepID=UPI000EFA588D|nr:4-hydroxy-tetrahydrodipicolinate reductase [Halalkalicoccus subterraneus]
MKVAVTGATGRMGREVMDAAREADHEVIGVSHSSAGEYAGVDIEPADEFGTLLSEHDPDATIDFTLPDPSVSYVQDCAEAGVPAVVGTTGFSDDQYEELRAASEEVPVLQAANFARGIQGLLSAVREAVAALPGYDVELTETHHNGKRDAPSGTANRVLDAIDDVRGDSPRVHGREGETPREEGEIGVHARRAGDITGEHEVLLAGNHEEVRLTHRAGSRGVFAAGAVEAAEWLAGRSPGWYDFSDTLPDSQS